MTTIDETIECCEEIAEDLEEREKRARGADWKYANYCKERAENNRQLAEWLKNYKKLLSDVDDIKAELHENAEMHSDGDYYLREEWIDEIIDKHIGKEKP